MIYVLLHKYSFASVSDLSLNLIERLKITEGNENISKAHNSQFHDLYPKLEYDAISQNFQSWPTSLILKARCGMLNLNARSFLSSTAGICPLCNLNEVKKSKSQKPFFVFLSFMQTFLHGFVIVVIKIY